MSYIRKIGKNYVIEFTWKGKRFSKSLRLSEKKRALRLQKKIDFELRQ